MLERFAREDLGEVVGRVDVGPTKGVGEHDGAFGAVGRDDAGKFGDDVGVAVKRSAPPQMEVEDERKGNRHAEEPPTKKVKRKKKGSSIDDLFAGL